MEQVSGFSLPNNLSTSWTFATERLVLGKRLPGSASERKTIGHKMRLAVLLLLSSCIAGCLLYDMAGAETEALAFPGAQGFGAASRGGRGGKILFVKNLNDAGPGSLRQAIETSGPRIIVFEVAGTIVLTEMLRVTAPFMTIAGQTAPPPGITIQGRGCLDVRTHDVLVQHVRFRATNHGEWNDKNIDYFDGFQITGSAGYPPHRAYNVVFDHVSATGAADEGCGIWCARNVTISNSLIALNAKGVLIGNNSREISLIGNLVMHNRTRQPRINSGVTANILRNIFYNGPNTQMQIGESKLAPGFTSRPHPDRPTMINLVENSFFSGPRTKNRHQPIQLLYANQTLNAQTKVYLNNNFVDGAPLTIG